MSTYFLAGIYHGDISITLGAFTDEDSAKSLGRAVSECIDGSCYYTQPIVIDSFNLDALVKKSRDVFEEKGIIT